LYADQNFSCLHGTILRGGDEVMGMSRIATTETAQAHIARMVKRVAKMFHPKQIILFGSHARGEAGPDSDVDLLVVTPVQGAVRDMRLEIRAALGDVPFPLDVLVATPEEFAWRKEVVGTIEWAAAREGKVVYAQA
jgi:predicted nucleotidyltransferase